MDKRQERLGRLVAPDPRDENYKLRELRPDLMATPTSGYKYHYDSGPFLDQGATSTCVGHGWAHWVAAGPLTQPYPDPYRVYAEAQLQDEWEGAEPAYYGTSVRAGAKVLRGQHVESFLWADDLDEMLSALWVAPVVIGVNWYHGMFDTDAKGLIHPTGPLEGGHCLLATGVSMDRELIRLKNSWGKGWGVNGRAWVSFADMARLIQEDGEVCRAVERRAV